MVQPLDPGVRRGYALGSVATGTFGTVPGLLLLPYLTGTIGISALLAGIIVVLPKAWDVVLNPVAGRISDRSSVPRRRPFLIRAGLVLAVTFALLFAGPTESKVAGGIWVVVLFLACASAYAFFQVPYVAMPAEMTEDYAERTRLMTWRVAVLAVAILLAGATAPAVKNAFDDAATGHRVMGVYVGVIIAVGVVGAWWGTRHAPEHPVPTAEGSMRDQLRLVTAVPAFRALLLTFVVQAVGVGALLAGVDYVASDLLESEGATTVLFAAFIAPALLVTPLWERYARRRGKKSGYVLSSTLLAVGALGLLTARLDLPVVVYLSAAVAGIGYAGAQVFPLAMLPDVAAQDAERSGDNRIGVFTGVWTAGETLGLALGPGVFALVLALGGFVSGDDAVQPESALNAIAIGFAVVPAVLVAAGLLFLRRYSDERVAP